MWEKKAARNGLLFLASAATCTAPARPACPEGQRRTGMTAEAALEHDDRVTIKNINRSPPPPAAVHQMGGPRSGDPLKSGTVVGKMYAEIRVPK